MEPVLKDFIGYTEKRQLIANVAKVSEHINNNTKSDDSQMDPSSITHMVNNSDNPGGLVVTLLESIVEQVAKSRLTSPDPHTIIRHLRSNFNMFLTALQKFMEENPEHEIPYELRRRCVSLIPYWWGTGHIHSVVKVFRLHSFSVLQNPFNPASVLSAECLADVHRFVGSFNRLDLSQQKLLIKRALQTAVNPLLFVIELLQLVFVDKVLQRCYPFPNPLHCVIETIYELKHVLKTYPLLVEMPASLEERIYSSIMPNLRNNFQFQLKECLRLIHSSKPEASHAELNHSENSETTSEQECLHDFAGFIKSLKERKQSQRKIAIDTIVSSSPDPVTLIVQLLELTSDNKKQTQLGARCVVEYYLKLFLKSFLKLAAAKPPLAVGSCSAKERAEACVCQYSKAIGKLIRMAFQLEPATLNLEALTAEECLENAASLCGFTMKSNMSRERTRLFNRILTSHESPAEFMLNFLERTQAGETTSKTSVLSTLLVDFQEWFSNHGDDAATVPEEVKTRVIAGLILCVPPKEICRVIVLFQLAEPTLAHVNHLIESFNERKHFLKSILVIERLDLDCSLYMENTFVAIAGRKHTREVCLNKLTEYLFSSRDSFNRLKCFDEKLTAGTVRNEKLIKMLAVSMTKHGEALDSLALPNLRRLGKLHRVILALRDYYRSPRGSTGCRSCCRSCLAATERSLTASPRGFGGLSTTASAPRSSKATSKSSAPAA